nr:hypothetical protein [Tanacetum cinerariifolium]
MVVRVSLAMSPGLSARIVEVAAMFDSAFQEDEEVEESSDSYSKSKGAEDEGPTAKDEDPAAGDEGLAARVEGPGVDDESYSLDDESHGVDDETRSLDDEGHGVDIDGLGLEEEEAVPKGQGSGSAPKPKRSERVSTSRQPTLTTWTDPKDGMVYIDVLVYPPPAPHVQTPPSPEWTSGSLPISQSPSVAPSPVSLPMIPLTVPSPIASPMTTLTTTIPVDEDQFIEERTVVTFGALWMPVLAFEAWEMRGRVTALEQERDQVAAMSDSAFRKRFRSSYNSLPSLTLPVRKSESEGAEDEGPTTEDEDPVVRDEGLAARVEGLDMDDESYGLDDESYGLDDESYGLDDKSHGMDDEIHGVDDESRGLDDEGHGVEIDGLGLEEEEEVVPEGQQRAASVMRTVVSAPLGLGYGALRHRELALEGDHIYSTFEVGQGSDSAPEPERPDRVSASRQPTLTTWIDPEDSSPMATSTATIPVDEDQFIEVGAQLKLYRSILQDHTQHLDAMPPILFAEIDRDEMTVVTFGALWRPVLTLEAWAGRDRSVARATGDERSCYCIGAGKEP